jgi:hypothetical protein
VIDGDVEVLAVERNAPGCATQFAWTLETNRALFARGGFRCANLLAASFSDSAAFRHDRSRVESGADSIMVVVVTTVGVSLFVPSSSKSAPGFRASRRDNNSGLA